MMQDLTPKELFDLQKTAYLSGDMAAVKDMAQIARSRMNLPKSEDWKTAKEDLDKMDFPMNDRNFTEVNMQEKHIYKKETHELKTYKKWFDILGYEVEAKYNRCEECHQTRNAVMRMYNNQSNECYEKWFVISGEDIKKLNKLEQATKIFSAFALLFIFIK